ncbi:MAG TPA: helix-turn-helix domain-containing protein [Caldisericia bacterium]|nr:helix-turn-helix domain-containing protein [Caldisericia bacterium]HPI84256.1 helix-turn-helix domain-containing protein [Caldisericia bacterium]HPQ93434.1 helix-turn-helix domain-containing protein [Caldisericia bacterium]HRV74892.1 helix-turn-helix domain-containing protein [Caldisericia bacterium]
MIINNSILSEEVKTIIKDEIAKHIHVDPTEIEIGGILYELTNESLNLKEVTRKTLIKAIARSRGKITDAARALGVTRKTLYAMIAKHSLESIVNIHE